MNRKLVWVIAIAEAVSLLLLIAVVLFPSVPTALDEGMSLTTDKTVYKVDETITVTVKNNSAKPIWYKDYDYSCMPSAAIMPLPLQLWGWLIYSGRPDTELVPIPLLPFEPLAMGCGSKTYELKAGETITLAYPPPAWFHDPKILSNKMLGWLFSSYELRFEYTLNEEAFAPSANPSDFATAFSNEFAISAELSECDALESEIETLFEEIKSCKKDDDCIVDQSLPHTCFGCYVIRSTLYDNSEQLSLINEKIEEYLGKCPTCLLECGIPPEKLACENHKCTTTESDNKTSSSPITYPPNTNSEEDRNEIETVYQTYIGAGQNCDIELSNSTLTERTLEIIHPTCDNLYNESKCYVGREHKIKTKPEIAVLYLTPFSYGIENPFFFSKEDGKWKIDLYRMAFGMAMAGSTCDSGWGWTNLELRNEFCSYFQENECPDG